MEISDYVKNYDPQNQFDVLKNSFEQIIYAEQNKYDITGIDKEAIKNIVLTGLGGSAISGDVFANMFGRKLTVPFVVNRNYTMPAFVNKSSLVIASSYSGNTEETLSAVKEASGREAQVICVTTGGRLEEYANEKGLTLIKLQKGFQPRFAFWLSIFTLIKFFEMLNFIGDQRNLINNAIELLRTKGETLSKEENNFALRTAKSLIGFIPVIYSADTYSSGAGLRLKGQFNENSKVHAFHNVIPEMNHNEIIGWEAFEESKFPVKLIFITDNEYHHRIKLRFEILKSIIQKLNIEIINLESHEEDFELRILDLIYTGDWISYYLAVLRKHDPSEINNINYLKEELAKRKT